MILLSDNIGLKVRVPNWMVPIWWKVAYKIPPEKLTAELTNLIKIRPNEKFSKVVSGYVKAVVEKGELPPNEILTPILNLANDFTNGREMIMRTGDYIALQKFVRAQG